MTNADRVKENVDRIKELRALGKLTILVTEGTVTLTLIVGNYCRVETFSSSIADAINYFYDTIDLNKHLIEALNCE